jgi:hypothetical protein
MDDLCNEAFNELLTQEFNLDGDDFEDDSRSEVGHPEEASHADANLSEEAGKYFYIQLFVLFQLLSFILMLVFNYF